MSEKAEETLRRAFDTFDADELTQCVRRLLDAEISVFEVANLLSMLLKETGDRFEKGEIFLMHLGVAGAAAKKALTDVIEPEILKSGGKRVTLGKLVIGTVAGDIHDIGKSIVAAMLFTAGFDVCDLGVDVPVQKFMREVENTRADILALSALLSTTLPIQREIIEALKAAGMREKVKVMIGGAPATKEWAESIGADGYAENAIEAVKVAKQLMCKP